MRPFDNIIDAAERTGHKVTARKFDSALTQCGAFSHPDKQPSLSVSEGDDGGVVLHCHARNCPPEDIVAGFGLAMADLFVAKPEPTAKAQIAAVYNYTEVDGTLIYQVVRMTPKTFRQRRPEAGGWIWDLKGIDRLPYHLPQLIEAVSAGETVVIVEGEKDVEALTHLGFTATCNSGGAGKWSDSFASYFTNASVVIIPDNDEPGREHAKQVGASLTQVAASVRVLEISGLPAKGDVSDWINAGGNREEFKHLIAQAPTFDQWDKAPDLPSLPGLIGWTSFWDEDADEAEWFYEPILAAGRVTVINGAAKSGKSLLSLDIAAWVASLGRRVLYLDYEMSRPDLRERMTDLGYGPASNLGTLSYVLIPDLPPLDTPGGGAGLMELVGRLNPELVVIDTISKVILGKEDSADTFREFYRNSIMPLKARNLTVLLLDHLGKDAARGARGSSAKVADPDVVFDLKGADGDTITLKLTHSRVPWIPALVRLKRSAYPLHHEEVEAAWPAGTHDAALALERLGASPDISVRKAAAILRDDGLSTRQLIVAAAVKFRKGALK